MSLLSILSQFIANNTAFVEGTNLFYNVQPDVEATNVVYLTENKTINTLPVQLDMEKHLITITTRSTTNDGAYATGEEIYTLLLGIDDNLEATGIVNLSNEVVCTCTCYSKPIWSKEDAKKRQYYNFNVMIYNKQL